MDLSKLIAVVKATAEAMVPGAAETIRAGEAVLELADSVAPTLASDDQQALQGAIDGLIAKMSADVDAAVAALKGE
jgi:hypothetical protein